MLPVLVLTEGNAGGKRKPAQSWRKEGSFQIPGDFSISVTSGSGNEEQTAHGKIQERMFNVQRLD